MLHRPWLNSQHAIRLEHPRRPLVKVIRAHLAALHGQHANPTLRQASAAILVYDLDRSSNILEDGHRSTLLLFIIMRSCGSFGRMENICSCIISGTLVLIQEGNKVVEHPLPFCRRLCYNLIRCRKRRHRDVAQLGRALGSGPRGRRFKSCRLDHYEFKDCGFRAAIFLCEKSEYVPIVYQWNK